MKEKTYKKNYLTDVIFEMKFPPVLGLIDGSLSPSGFQDAVMDEFPENQTKRGEKVTLNMLNPENSQINTKEEFSSWVFFDKPPENIPTKTVTLNYNNVILS
ncbi:MAG: hypothetical protein LBT66_00745 [Methanobrevibacter sp.]|jgi:uncharacterized protein (TIGR04255 family)|nr:hypothetical protein [Candidatus Methanovirga meridionalis]